MSLRLKPHEYLAVARAFERLLPTIRMATDQRSIRMARANWTPFTTRSDTIGALNSATGRKLYGKAAEKALAQQPAPTTQEPPTSPRAPAKPEAPPAPRQPAATAKQATGKKPTKSKGVPGFKPSTATEQSVSAALPAHAASIGTTVPDLATSYGFADEQELISTSAAAKDAGFGSIEEASAATGAAVGTDLAKALAGGKKTPNADDDLALVGFGDAGYRGFKAATRTETNVHNKLTKLASSKGTTIPELAKKHGFADPTELVRTLAAAHDAGFKRLSEAVKKQGAKVGTPLAKSFNVDSKPLRGESIQKPFDLDPKKIQQAKDDAAELRELTGHGDKPDDSDKPSGTAALTSKFDKFLTDNKLVKGKIPEVHQQRVAKAVKHISSRMPDHIAEEVAKNIKHFVIGDKSQAEEVYKLIGGNTDHTIDGKKAALGGFYGFGSGVMCVTSTLGGTVAQNDRESRLVRESLAHEMTHALDDSKGYSKSPEWQSAWQSDIKEGKVVLSEYAKTNALEGFAEVGRYLWGTGGKGDTADDLKQSMPNVYAFLTENGLVK